MCNCFKLLLFICLFVFSFNVSAEDSINNAELDIDEIMVEEDPFIGVTIDLEKFQPMVYVTDFNKETYGSLYVRNINRLITSLAESKKMNAKGFKHGKKKIKFLSPREKFTIIQVLKTAVYKENIPEETTTYILKDSKNKLYAIPEYILKENSTEKLTEFDIKLLTDFKDSKAKARVIVIFEKPAIYNHKKAPYTKKDLDSVFEFFLSRLAGYSYEYVRKSQRIFRISMVIPIDTLVYLISEFDSLHIEDMEIIY